MIFNCSYVLHRPYIQIEIKFSLLARRITTKQNNLQKPIQHVSLENVQVKNSVTMLHKNITRYYSIQNKKVTVGLILGLNFFLYF